MEFQRTEEVLESKVLVGGGGVHGEVGNEIAVFGLLHGREGYAAGAVGQRGRVDSGDFIAHEGDGLANATQFSGAGVALLGGSEIETVDKSEDLDGVVLVPLDGGAIESGFGVAGAVLHGGTELVVTVVLFDVFLARSGAKSNQCTEGKAY